MTMHWRQQKKSCAKLLLQIILWAAPSQAKNLMANTKYTYLTQKNWPVKVENFMEKWTLVTNNSPYSIRVGANPLLSCSQFTYHRVTWNGRENKEISEIRFAELPFQWQLNCQIFPRSLPPRQLLHFHKVRKPHSTFRTYCCLSVSFHQTETIYSKNCTKKTLPCSHV